ncbi:ABC transporter permease [Azospirillum sp. Vi22]|uniref:FtsX-like permease family protein n=1 Tax=Azospirillum baldaniorum TaxID=1064539 RepID=UPI00157B150E|nr:ABC transporter permease [Azospirillum baldaniorum]NUB10620.1 ABC transporter permease [Azospirillum baldaniorum]
MMARVSQLFRLALADLRVEWPIALCQVIAIAAVLTPLLVLAGLQQGAIGTLIDRLNRDPAMRLVVPEVTGGHRFDHAWFAAMAARPEVDFVMPATRQIAGQIDLLRDEASGSQSSGQPNGRGEARVTLLPTAPGDPVTGPHAAAAAMDGVILSARAADRLGVTAPGALVTAYAERTRGGKAEPLAFPLRVVAVLPTQRDGGMSAFAALPLVQAVQDFRDGKAVPALGATAGDPAGLAADYPLFRLYARSIRDVQALATDFQANGIAVATRHAEIASTLTLDRNLRAILLIIATLSVAGYVVAVTASQWGNLRRKRRDLAILNLTGYGSGWLVAFPVAQAAILALIGSLVAAAAFVGAAATINGHFQESIASGEAACRLGAPDLLAAAALTLALSLLPAAAIGLACRRIETSEELRSV